jgi:hypothetical protein
LILTGGATQPSMKTKHSDTSSPNNKRAMLIVLIIFVVISSAVALLNTKQAKWLMMTPQERFDDTTTQIRPTMVEDSVEIAEGKIPQSVFESEYTAEKIYSELVSNKVAFDMKYKGHRLDIFGVITRIKTDDDCAIVEFQTGNTGFDVISFDHCNQGKDSWVKEVSHVSVGASVHIRGVYSASSSTDYAMSLYDCHIIN